MLSLIVAHDKNYAIGFEGWMPWKLKEDLKLFRKRTLNHRIVMGLTTFNTIGKPLPNRHTIIVCYPKENQLVDPNVSYCHDFKQFLEDNYATEEEIFICGGASIYTQALPYCRKMYISLVNGEWPADTWLPKYDPKDYLVLSEEIYEQFKVIEYLKKG
ncbi:MAG: dihydrofolate reductase [Erysipelotrichaceae bacterium]|nr:dihydrofolate reductase [Erysipelotrichaceae bacterium]